MAASDMSLFLSLICIFPIFLMASLFGISLIIFKPISLIIELSVKYFHRRNFKRLTSGLNPYFINQKQTNSDVIYIVLLMEDCNIQEHIRLLKNMLLTARNSKGELIAESLQTIPVLKYGFAFRMFDPNFNIDNHFSQSDVCLKSLKDLELLLLDENRKLFRKNAPKWEIKMFQVNDSFVQEQEINNNNNKKCHCMMIKMCHSLTDALSVGRALQFFNDKHKQTKSVEKLGKSKRYPVSSYRRYLYNILFFTPLESFRLFFKPDNKFFRTNSESSDMYFKFLKPIALDRVRAISKTAKVSYFDVYLSCLAAALRKFVCSKGGNTSDEVFISFPYSYQKTDEPIELTNKIEIIPFWLPLKEMASMDRLREISRRMDGIKDSPLPLLLGLRTWTSHVWPSIFQKAIRKWATPSFYISSVPFFKKPLKFFNDEALVDVLFNVIEYYGNGVIHVVHYTDRVRICLTVNSNIVKSDAEADLIIKTFEEEFNKLEDIVRKKKSS